MEVAAAVALAQGTRSVLPVASRRRWCRSRSYSRTTAHTCSVRDRSSAWCGHCWSRCWPSPRSHWQERVAPADRGAAAENAGEVRHDLLQAPIPAATYKQPADAATIVVPNVLLVRKDMKDELAEQLTKVICENKDALVAVNAAAKGITLENADETDPVPLHLGAKKALDTLK